MSEQKPRGNRFYRYAPLIVWTAVIFAASTDALSGANTSRIIRPFLLWLVPNISEAKIEIAHFVVRKAAHFTEYAIFALLAVRAFATSSRTTLRRRYFIVAFLLIALFSLSDEFHQSFVPTRTGSIYDSLIDMSGGLTVLVIFALWQRRTSQRSPQITQITQIKNL